METIIDFQMAVKPRIPPECLGGCLNFIAAALPSCFKDLDSLDRVHSETTVTSRHARDAAFRPMLGHKRENSRGTFQEFPRE